MTGAAAMVWEAGSHYINYCFTSFLSPNYLQSVMQHYVYETNLCSEDLSVCDTVSSLFPWIQTGLLLSFFLVLKILCPASSPILRSFAEILVSVTGLEYAFTKAPKNMRSLVMSIFLSTSAFAVALDVALPCKLSRKSYFMILYSV